MSRGTVLPKVYAVIRDEERDGDNGMHRTIARIKFQLINKKLVNPRQLLSFKIIPQTPIANHMKSRGMSVGFTDIFPIVHTHRALDINKPLAKRMRIARQIRHKRKHPRIHKQECRVVLRHQRNIWDEFMSTRLVKIKIFLEDLV